MPHRERHAWVEEISTINKKINKQASPSGSSAKGSGGFTLDLS